MDNSALLRVNNLSVSVLDDSKERTILNKISFALHTNEILAVVGESGSGKSITSLSILGLLPKKVCRIAEGEIIYNNENIIEFTSSQFQKLRGNKIAMIFQEPMSSLNPSMRCGLQVEEILKTHLTSLTAKQAKGEVLELFIKVKLPNPDRIFSSYPHELSGGQKQRVMIAMAIACKPEILIADEPTTALDVTVQKEIISLLKSLQKSEGMSIIFVSHDLTLVSEIADRVLVMYKGEIVEEGDVKRIFLNPTKTYTKALIKSRPSSKIRLKVLPTIQDFISDSVKTEIITKSSREKQHRTIYSKPPILEVIDLEKEFISNLGLFKKTERFKAVNGVSFKVYEGETLGLVGESGCGKSTLSNAILQLDKATSGEVIYKGVNITDLNSKQLQKLRKEIQIIFQDPFASLNPRIPIGKAILEPMLVHGIGKTKQEREQSVKDLLVKVGLEAEHFYRYPHEFSGGQRQRIGIARTIALEPRLIICDESVSALDISVQAQVLNLLNSLKEDYGFTYIFISHDLAVVKYMSDQLLVMNKGKIEEINEADSVYESPKSDYTKKLIHAIPKGL